MAGTIIGQSRGKRIPDAYLEEVLKQDNIACFGAAAVVGASGKKEIQEFSVTTPSEITLENINSLLDSIKDTDLVIYFKQTADGAISLEELQPFILIEDDQKEPKPVLIAFLEGDFPKYANDEAAHAPEFFAAKRWLTPKVHEMWELCDKDIEKFSKVLKGENFRNDLTSSDTRSVITLLAVNGLNLTFDACEDVECFDWGYASRIFGEYPVTQLVDMAHEPEKPLTFAEKMAAKKNAPLPAKFAAAEKTVIHAEGPVDKGKVIEAKRDGLGDTSVLVPGGSTEWNTIPVPENYNDLNNKQKKHWIELAAKANGTPDYFPAEYKKIKVLLLPKPVGTQNGLKDIGTQMAEAVALGQKLGKDTEPHNKDIKAKALPVVKTTLGLPVMQPDMKRSVVAFLDKGIIQKIQDANADIVEHPEKMAEIERRLPNFATQIARPEDEILNWVYDSYVELGKAHPEALAVLTKNLAFEVKSLRAMMNLRTAPPKEEKVGATTIVRAEHVSSFAARQAAKKAAQG